MKKILLLTALAVMSSAGFAQQTKTSGTKAKLTPEMMRKSNFVNVKTQMMDAKSFKASKTRRAVADDVWYTRPDGTYYLAGENSAYLLVPPFVEVKFNNACPDAIYKEAKWMMGETDGTQYTDENNDFIMTYPKPTQFGMGYYLPTIVSGNSSFTLGAAALPIDSVAVTEEGSIVFQPFNYIQSPNYSIATANTANGVQAVVAFGTEQMPFDVDGDGTQEDIECYAIRQFYEKPLTGIYLYSIFTGATVFSTTPLAEGQKLTATINAVSYDESGKAIIGDVIGVMEATMDDIQISQNRISGIVNEAYGAMINFKKVLTNDFGDAVADPIAINTDFAVTIEGFDQPNVKVGFGFCNVFDDPVEYKKDTYVPTYSYYKRVDNGEKVGALVSSNAELEISYNLALNFSGEMDAIYVDDADEGNVLYATEQEQGGNKYLIGLTKPEEGEEQGSFVQVSTVWPFFDTDEGGNKSETDNLTFEGVPDWAEPLVYDDYYYDPQYPNAYGLNLVSFAVNPLPEGQTGRAARVWIKSKRGAMCNAPIYLLQGDATVADGIAAIKFDAQGKMVGTYNLGGARVSENAKGLIIKDGKKLLKK